jgi:DNA-binding NarL/FixJ family response regulator
MQLPLRRSVESHAQPVSPMPKRILIADDDSSVRHAIRTFIEHRSEFEVYEATNGNEALQQATALNPDLIVLDLSMPTANGVEAAALLHSRMPRTPVVIYTMYGDLVRDSLAKILGIAALVSKSEGVAELLGRIKALLEAEDALAGQGH